MVDPTVTLFFSFFVDRRRCLHCGSRYSCRRWVQLRDVLFLSCCSLLPDVPGQRAAGLKAGIYILENIISKSLPSLFSDLVLLVMNWKQSKYFWSSQNLLSIGANANLNVCVVTCQVKNENGKIKQYLDIKDGICCEVDSQNPRKHSIYMLDCQELESHSPDFVIPMNGRSSAQTRADILQCLMAYVHPRPGGRCGLCDLWVQNVTSCQFLEPLFTNRTCSEHIHFNIRGRIIESSA